MKLDALHGVFYVTDAAFKEGDVRFQHLRGSKAMRSYGILAILLFISLDALVADGLRTVAPLEDC